ncbi:hypothetical protein LX86_005080, partial [Lentzea aerocolonigenes]|nr:hypothetical protein [Lentzea aerocolonigenes]
PIRRRTPSNQRAQPHHAHEPATRHQTFTREAAQHHTANNPSRPAHRATAPGPQRPTGPRPTHPQVSSEQPLLPAARPGAFDTPVTVRTRSCAAPRGQQPKPSCLPPPTAAGPQANQRIARRNQAGRRTNRLTARTPIRGQPPAPTAPCSRASMTPPSTSHQKPVVPRRQQPRRRASIACIPAARTPPGQQPKPRRPPAFTTRPDHRAPTHRPKGHIPIHTNTFRLNRRRHHGDLITPPAIQTPFRCQDAA